MSVCIHICRSIFIRISRKKRTWNEKFPQAKLVQIIAQNNCLIYEVINDKEIKKELSHQRAAIDYVLRDVQNKSWSVNEPWKTISTLKGISSKMWPYHSAWVGEAVGSRFNSPLLLRAFMSLTLSVSVIYASSIWLDHLYQLRQSIRSTQQAGQQFLCLRLHQSQPSLFMLRLINVSAMPSLSIQSDSYLPYRLQFYVTDSI